MSDLKSKLDEELEALRTTRDELRVQLHLGASEVKEKWEQVEHAWENIELEAEKLRDVAEDVAEDVGSAARLLVEEIKDGYKNLKTHL